MSKKKTPEYKANGIVEYSDCERWYEFPLAIILPVLFIVLLSAGTHKVLTYYEDKYKRDEQTKTEVCNNIGKLFDLSSTYMNDNCIIGGYMYRYKADSVSLLNGTYSVLYDMRLHMSGRLVSEYREGVSDCEKRNKGSK